MKRKTRLPGITPGTGYRRKSERNSELLLLRRAGRLDVGRIADHGEAERGRVEHLLRDSARLIQGDAADQPGAAVEIVDAELVLLHLHEDRGDVLRRVEAERERA